MPRTKLSLSSLLPFLFVLFSIFWFASISQAQITSVSDPTSTPTPGVGHDYIKLLNETVNPATGSLSVRISVAVPPGRELTVPFAFTYDSSGAWFLEAVGGGSQPPTMSSMSNSNLGPLAWGGWATTFPQLSRVLVQQAPNFPVTDGHPTCDDLTGYVFTDPSGARHSLGLSHWYTASWQACAHSSFSESTIGGDDFYRAALVGASNNVSNSDGTAEIADPDGTVYNFGSSFRCIVGDAGTAELPSLAAGLPVSIEDRNGNIVNITTDVNHDGCSGFIAKDTAGRTALSVSHYGSLVNSTTTTSTVSVAGLSQPYTVTWSKVSPTGLSISHSQIGSASTCWSPPTVAAAWTPLSGTTGIGTYVVTAIALPNGQQYTFDYDPVTGFVKKIKYPSGGYVTYTWGINSLSAGIQYNDKNGLQENCAYLYDTPAITQRSVSFDGNTVALTQTFSYSTNWGTLPNFPNGPFLWVSKQATVLTTDSIQGTTSKIVYNYIPNTIGLGVPNLNSQTSNFVNAVAVENTIYHYGYSPSYPLLRTETKNWLDQFELLCDLSTLNDGSGQISGAFYSYSTYGGQVIDKKEFDYGQLTSTSSCNGGTLPTPARETVATYQSFAATPIYPRGASIFDRPSAVRVYGNGTLVAETDYSYDQSAVASVSNLPAGTHDETNYGINTNPPRGNVTRITKQCFPSCVNAVTTASYDETGQVSSRTDPCGNASCSDMAGTNHTTTLMYTDNFDSPPSGNTNAYLTKVTDALSHTSSFKYAYSDGQLISSTDQNVRTTGYLYNDSLRRLTEIDLPDGGKTTITYNDATYNASTPSPSVSTTKLGSPSPNITALTAFDGLGHTVRSVLTSDPDCSSGDRTDTTFDGLGRVYKVSNPYCTTGDMTYGLTTFTYDALGRTTQVAHPDGSTILTTYTGRATQIQDEGNGTQRVIRVSQTDALGRLSSLCEVSSSALTGQNGTPAACGQDIAQTGFLTSYLYDGLDNLTQVNQGTMAPRAFAYDSLSRLTSASNPESGSLIYTYDANGNVSTKKDARNITTTYTYDVLDRNTQKSYSDGTPTATFLYDASTAQYGIGIPNPVGRLVQATAGCAFTMNLYDPVGRVAAQYEQIPTNCSSPYPYLRLNYQYDLAGNMTSHSDGEFETFTNTYNGAGRLTSLTSSVSDSTHPPNLLSAVHYNALGAIASDTLGDGETEAWTYNDPRGRLTSYVAKLSSTTVYSLTIPNGGYAPNSNILLANDSANGNWTYSYDPFNRLIGSNKGGGAAVFSYVYDRFGNRWQQNGPNSFIATFTGNNPSNPQNNNRLDSHSYDAAGNLLNDGVHSYTYDAENRITTVDAGATATYLYDALGQRVEKTTPTSIANECGTTGTVFYVHDLAGHNAVYTPNGVNTCIDDIFADGRHLATYSGGTTFSHSDWLGTERLRTTYNGAVCESIASLPFGDGQTTTGYCYHHSPLHFTGKERDLESGLDNFGARYDSSSMGRFMSPDPLMASATAHNPQTWNRYTYALNNPLRFVDPDGMKEVSAEDCKKDSNCVSVKLNVIYDQNANSGKGLTDDQKSTFDAQLQRAKDQYGNADIHFDVTYTTGGTDANGNLQGLVKDSTNVIVSDSTPSGEAGVSQINQAGYALTGIDVTKSDTGTLSHELAHQFTGDTTGLLSAVSSVDPTSIVNRVANAIFDVANDVQRAQLSDEHPQYIKQPCTGCSLFNSGARQYQANLTQQAIRPRQ